MSTAACTYTHAYTHTYMHTHTRTHMHTRTCIRGLRTNSLLVCPIIFVFRGDMSKRSSFRVVTCNTQVLSVLVCMHVCMCVCVYACVHVCMCVGMCVCVCSEISLHKRIYTAAHKYQKLCTWKFIIFTEVHTYEIKKTIHIIHL